MSLGSFQFRESYERKLLNLNDDEKEVAMILADIKNGATIGLENSLMVIENEARKEYERTISEIISRVNGAKWSILENEYMHDMGMVECIIPLKSRAKKCRSKKSTPRNRPSPTRVSTRIKSSTILALDRPEVHATLSISARGEEYTTRQRPHQEISIIPESTIRSRRPQANKRSHVAILSPITLVPENVPQQLLTPSFTSKSPGAGVAQRAALNLRAPGYSSDIVMASSRPSVAASMINTGCSPSLGMPMVASCPAATAPQAPRTKNLAGHTYPELIARAITESETGRLKVSELYAILPVLSPTLMSKLIPCNNSSMNKKRKSAEDVFQENIRQNLSRNKSLFRNVKDPESGKSTGFWELATAATAPATPFSPVSSGNSPPSNIISSTSCLSASGSKRKSTPDCDPSSLKRAKTTK